MNPNKPTFRASNYDEAKGYEVVDPAWEQLFNERREASNARKKERGAIVVKEDIVIEQIDTVQSVEVAALSPMPVDAA